MTSPRHRPPTIAPRSIRAPVIAVVTALCLAACGSSSSGNGADTSASSSSGTQQGSAAGSSTPATQNSSSADSVGASTAGDESTPGSAGESQNSSPSAPQASQSSGAGSSVSPASLLPESIRSAGAIKVAVDPSYPPIETLGPDGKIVGMNVDMLNAVADELGTKIQFVNTQFPSIIAGLAAHRFDMGVIFTDTKAREEQADFVDAYNSGILYAVKAGDPILKTDATVPCGYTVAVNQGNIGVGIADADSKECVAQGKPAMKISTYPSADQEPVALSSGRVQAFVNSDIFVAYAVQQSNGKLSLLGPDKMQQPFGFAIQKGSALGPALVAALKVLIANGKYESILKQYNLTTLIRKNPTINQAVA